MNYQHTFSEVSTTYSPFFPKWSKCKNANSKVNTFFLTEKAALIGSYIEYLLTAYNEK